MVRKATVGRGKRREKRKRKRRNESQNLSERRRLGMGSILLRKREYESLH